MKQRLLLFFTALVLCIGTRATTVQVIDGLKYIIYTDQNCAVVIANNYTAEKIDIPAEITWEDKTYPVTELGNGCFKDCSEVKSINIPESVTNLGENCFWGCTFTSINIPSSVTSIGESCFGCCESLVSITIPSSVKSIGDYCFYDCQRLSSANIPSSITSLGNRIFENCRSLISVTIPSSVTSLGEGCFTSCKKLKSIVIPSSVTELGKNCFDGCESLETINIPSSVTSLGNYCFAGCYNLFSVNIQSPQITLGESCFSSTIITDFTIMATTPPAISSDCFNGCSIDKTKLIVPKASISSYKSAAVWKDFGTIVDADGGEVAGECEKPSISYTNGKLKFGSQTPGAEYHYTIKAADDCTDALAQKDEVSLAARYDISCYATADGYTRSKTSTARLYWINANMATDGIAPATQMRDVVVSTEGGIVTLSGLQENERVAFYSVSGIKLGETRALNGQASISASDDVVIARIGTQTIKVKR